MKTTTTKTTKTKPKTKSKSKKKPTFTVREIRALAKATYFGEGYCGKRGHKASPSGILMRMRKVKFVRCSFGRGRCCSQCNPGYKKVLLDLGSVVAGYIGEGNTEASVRLARFFEWMSKQRCLSEKERERVKAIVKSHRAIT